MEAISAKKIPVKAVRQGDTLDWDAELKVQVLWPPKNFKGSDNNSSVILRITHGKNSFLFPGDAEREAEEEIVQTYGPGLRSNVLKAPHHGSKTSSTEEFLSAVSPNLAVISCGRKNRYGHPYPAVLERLEKLGVSVYRTDLDGTVEIISDGETLSIKK
jgi:beta-lactamase superfamily II metal-dependent hydrolase